MIAASPVDLRLLDRARRRFVSDVAAAVEDALELALAHVAPGEHAVGLAETGRLRSESFPWGETRYLLLPDGDGPPVLLVTSEERNDPIRPLWVEVTRHQ